MEANPEGLGPESGGLRALGYQIPGFEGSSRTFSKSTWTLAPTWYPPRTPSQRVLGSLKGRFASGPVESGCFHSRSVGRPAAATLGVDQAAGYPQPSLLRAV